MSWRVVATVLIVIFGALVIWTVTADPVRQIGNSFEDADDGDGPLDVSGQIASLIRAFSNMFLILIFGVIGWGSFWLYRRESTRGQL